VGQGSHEYHGYNTLANLPVEEFNMWIDHNHLTSLPSCGFQLTWINSRHGRARTDKRLGRVVYNSEGMDAWSMVFCCTFLYVS